MTDENMIDETTEQFGVKLNGGIHGTYRTRELAEKYIETLLDEHQQIAEVVPVTADGLEILLG
jgi:hypothetical protein